MIGVIHNNKRSIITFPAEYTDPEKINLLMKNCDRIRLAIPWKDIVLLNLNSFRFFDGNYIPIDYKEDGG